MKRSMKSLSIELLLFLSTSIPFQISAQQMSCPPVITTFLQTPGLVYDLILDEPRGVMYAVGSLDYVVWRIDLQTQAISVYAGTGLYGSSGDGGPATSAEINPYAIAVDQSGNLYISEPGGARVRKVDPNT